MKTPELTAGEAGFIILMGIGFVIGVIELYEQAGVWLDNNQQVLETIRVATMTAEALRVTPSPTPLTTPTPDTAQILATVTSLLGEIK